MYTLSKILVLIISIGFTMDVFAATKTLGTVPSKSTMIVFSDDGEEEQERDDNSSVERDAEDIQNERDKQAIAEMRIEEKRKDREKTINDINSFLIESYKLKIDRILANLNMSIERITKNDPVAQAKLLGKIRGDVNIKIQTINSQNISENRRKILSSVFWYIRQNLDDKISRLVGQK